MTEMISSIQALRRAATRPDAPGGTYPGLRPRREVHARGSVIDGGRALRCGVVVDRDVAIPLRDGVIVYTDIVRPSGRDADLPVLVAWSPYGKQDTGSLLDMIPGRAGIATDALSNLQKWEGPDPGYWCAHGYAVANVDPRGVNSSGGDAQFWSESEGRDAFDVIEWLAAQSWSNGKIAMAGNSWLAVSQWFTAAQRPPHLAAIAPWEGMSDYYRDMAVRGGIPTGDAFCDFVLTHSVRGNATVEDIPAMITEHPLFDDYWATKRAAVEQITVPAYVVASWTQLHSSGTLDAFRRLPGDKWLRVHNTHEWPDFYSDVYTEDLRGFFDHYLLGVDNGWQRTPTVRLSILDPGGTDVVDLPEPRWPIAATVHQPLYLDVLAGRLTAAAPPQESEVRYAAADGQVVLRHRFDHDTDLVGYSNLRLWVQADGNDDMDLFVRLDKVGVDGAVLSPLVLGQPVQATSGQLRVSHRRCDPHRSTPSEPFLTHAHEDLLGPGEIVPVDIGLWATAIRFHAGEGLAVTISGARLIPAELNLVSTAPLRNHGSHILHAGGRYDSHLLLPLFSRPNHA